MAARYGIADLTGGEIALVDANDSTNDTTDGQAADTDLEVAIVNGASVNAVDVPPRDYDDVPMPRDPCRSRDSCGRSYTRVRLSAKALAF